MPNTYPLPKAACLFFVRPDHRFAVVTRRGSEQIAILGGKEDPNETMAETAAREGFEEAGVVVDPSTLILLYRGECEAGPDGQAFDCGAYLAYAPMDAELVQKEAGIKPRWATGDELLATGAFKDYNRKVLDAYIALHVL
jgi:8-oxo-dGTP pyrophosphatase MutT (NUDIX family)